MSLLILPDDVLVMVLGYLAGDRKTLTAVSLACKRLNGLGLGILYSHIPLQTERDDLTYKLRLFTQSILSNPSLGKLVRSIDLTSTDWVWDGGISDSLIEGEDEIPNGVGEPKNVDQEKLQNTVRDVVIPKRHRDRWLAALEASPRNLDALVAVLLVHLPNVRRFETQWAPGPVYTPALFSKSLSPSPLTSLTHLKITCDDFQSKYTNQDLLPLLQLPSLTHVFGYQWGKYWRQDAPERDHDLPSTSIKHLELRHSFLPTFELQGLIHACPSLETFILHREGIECKCHSFFSTAALSSLLAPIRPTLKHLRLSQEQCEGPYDVLAGENIPLDFSQFPALVTLHVAATHLMADPEPNDLVPRRKYKLTRERQLENQRLFNMELWERLPRSLEVLYILGPCSKPQSVLILKALSEGLSRERFPHLREIRLHMRFKAVEGVFDSKGLRERALEEGIDLRKMDNTPNVPPGHDERCAVPDKTDWGMDGEYEWGSHCVSKEHVRDLDRPEEWEGKEWQA